MVFADEFANDPDFVVPRVLGNSPRVLVTSWMESEASLAQVIKDGTPEQRAHFGQLYARFLVAGPTRTGLLHAAQHQGPFRTLADGPLVSFDYGAVARIPASSSRPLAVPAPHSNTNRP